MSYNTPAEATAYFAALFGYDLWLPLTEAVQQQALNSARQQLDVQCIWSDEKTDPEQVEAFPRNGDALVPQDVKNAECEIAYNIVATDSTSTDGGDPLAELTAGSVTLKFNTGSSTANPIINDYTTDLLSQYGLCGGTGSTKLVPLARA